MVVALVYQRADEGGNYGIAEHQKVEGQRGDLSIKHDLPEIADKNVYGIYVEHVLYERREGVYRIEYRRHIHKKLGKHSRNQ